MRKKTIVSRIMNNSAATKLGSNSGESIVETLVTYLYKLAFYNGKQGDAAAVSVIGFLILFICASIYMVSVLKKGDD